MRLSARAMLARRRRELAEVEARTGLPLIHLRRQKLLPPGGELIVRDVNARGQPMRLLRWDGRAIVPTLLVYTIDRESRLLERIDLSAPDADKKLEKYFSVDEKRRREAIRRPVDIGPKQKS